MLRGHPTVAHWVIALQLTHGLGHQRENCPLKNAQVTKQNFPTTLFRQKPLLPTRNFRAKAGHHKLQHPSKKTCASVPTRKSSKSQQALLCALGNPPQNPSVYRLPSAASRPIPMCQLCLRCRARPSLQRKEETNHMVCYRLSEHFMQKNTT